MSLGPDRLAQLDAALAFLAGRLEHDRPIGPLSTYQVGGPARRYVEVAAPDELAQILSMASGIPRPSDDVLVVGKGSNLLVADGGVDALVLQLGEAFAEIEVHGATVQAGGSAPGARRARRRGQSPASSEPVMEPGSVSGAVRMNAGGHGADMAASLVGVRVVDLATGEDVRGGHVGTAPGVRRSSLRQSRVW